MRFLVINNLVSGYREGKIYDIVRSMVKDGDEVVIRSSDGTTDMRGFLHDAAGFDAVLASGGDGTVATVSYLLAGSGVPVLPIPAGTGNLLALNLATPNEPHALAKLAREDRTLDFDLGELEVSGHRYGFGIMAGTGYDAEIMEEAEPNKRLWGPLAYFGAAFTKVNHKPAHYTLVLDGKTIEMDALGVLIVNFSKIQFDLSVTHNNRPRDGWFDVAVLKGASPVELIPAVGAAVLDAVIQNPDRSASMDIYRARTVSISSDPPMKIEYDGEVTHLTTPFSARILPRAARYIVSDEGYEIFGREEAEEAEEADGAEGAEGAENGAA